MTPSSWHGCVGIVLIALVTPQGCRSGVSAPSATITGVQVSGGKIFYAVGQIEVFTAIATFSDGSTKDETATATWTTSNSGVVAVVLGSVTSTGPGTATISATVQGTAGSDRVSVVLPNWRFLGAPTLTTADTQVQVVAVDPRDDQTLYVGTTQGLCVTRNAGGSWEEPVTGNVMAIALDPRNADRVYATIVPRDLVRSTDRGQSFSLVKRFDDLLVSLRFSVYQPGALYVGFGGSQDPNPSGTFKTVDDGVTWIRQPFGMTGALIPWSVAEDPLDGTLYAGTEIADHPQPYHPQLFRSVDFGQTWTDATGIITWHVVRLGVDRSNHTVYALAEGPGLYRSPDHGRAWTQVVTNVGLSLVVDPIQSSRLFAGTTVAGNVNGGAFVSTEAGLDSVPYGLSGRVVVDLSLNGSSTRLYAACIGSGIFVTDLPSP